MHSLAEIVLHQAKDNGTSLTRDGRGYKLHIYTHYEVIKTSDTNYASYKLSFNSSATHLILGIGYYEQSSFASV